MNPLEQWQAAYIAGVVDGEGCFTAHYEGGNPKRLINGLQVANTDLRLLSFARGATGLGFIHHRCRPARPTHRQGYLWTVSARADLVALLPALIPYLIGKRTQAEMMLEVCRRRIALVPFDEAESALVAGIKSENGRRSPQVEV